MDLYSRTQEYGCASCYGESDLMSSQELAGSGSAWYKQTAKAMDELTKGLSKSGRNLTTKKQRKELGDVGIQAVKQKVNPTGAAIDQFDDLYLTGKGHCGLEMKGKGAKKDAKKAAKKAAKKVAKAVKIAKPNKKTQKKMAKGAVGGAIAGGITGAAAGGPAGAVGGCGGAVGGATGAYVEGKM